jgi:hypothetical protein
MTATERTRRTVLAALTVLASAALAADDLYVYPDKGQTAEQLERDDAHAKQEKQLDDYDRAYGACLGGRGYTVR